MLISFMVPFAITVIIILLCTSEKTVFINRYIDLQVKTNKTSTYIYIKLHVDNTKSMDLGTCQFAFI